MSALFRAKRTADFDGLYRHHAPSVYRYAYAVLGNHADAEDVTQQTFFNAYRAIAQGTKPRKAENWLITIAHNEVRRHFRSSQGKPFEVELDELVARPAPERTDPSLAEVLRALQQLPPPQRAALVMREFEGRSYAEIAQIMNVTQSALEGLIFRARRALAEHLEGALTCSEAEQALSRRLDGRLPRREGRRLKAHLRACPLCIRFADVQKRQRSLLKGLSIMPIPASLFLFRGEPAVAATGLGAGTAAGGTAALGIGGAAAGAGGTGIAAGVVAKVVAVAAAAAVTGGVGYGAATGFDAVTKPERKVTHAAVEQTLRGKRGVAAALDLAPRSGPDRPAKAHGHRKARKAKAAPANSTLRGEKAEKVEKPKKGVARARGKAALVVKASPSKPAATKPQEPKARTRPAAAKKTGRIERARPKPVRSKPVRPKPVQRAQADEKPKPLHDADPAPPPDVPGRGPK